MYDVTYHRAGSLAEALELLAGAEDAQILAGGQTLIPTMKARLAAPSDLVDISGVAGLTGVREDGDVIEIGAVTTHAAIAGSAVIRTRIPGLASLAARVGDPAVRHKGTIGGSLANNDPAACYPAAALALGATIVTDRRAIVAEDFFLDMFATDLAAGEVITAVRVPVPGRSGYGKFPQPASRYPMAGVFAALTKGGPRVAVTGAGEDGVFRSRVLEDALATDWSAASLASVEVPTEGLATDIHAASDYRAALVRAMAIEAVKSS